MRPINPLPRGADLQKQKDGLADPEQSPPARGRHLLRVRIDYVAGFIPSEEGQTSSHTLTSHRPTIHPSCEGQTSAINPLTHPTSIHPSYERQPSEFVKTYNGVSIHLFLRKADVQTQRNPDCYDDSSLLAKGRHSVFMRLSAALNTSLCNFHKRHFRLIHIFNMPKNPPHFHFFQIIFCFFNPHHQRHSGSV